MYLVIILKINSFKSFVVKPIQMSIRPERMGLGIQTKFELMISS